jgi:hypothetical protein
LHIAGVGGHAEHYLRRIDRLSAAHAELALSLYRDPGLVAHVLRFEKLPDGPQRVAISLDDPVEGPFLIVTREGHFVTCLGKGMRVRADQPVVKREQLDRLASELESLRRLLHDSQQGDLRETGELLASVETCGPQLGREQFESISRWVPLLGSRFFANFLEVGMANMTLYERLSRVKNLTHRRHERELHRYWEQVWALGHYSLLVGSDSGKSLERLLSPPIAPVDAPDSMLVAPTRFACATALVPVAVRTAWMMAQAPRALVGPLKRELGAATDLRSTVEVSLPLIAISGRSSRLRAEIGKVFARTTTAGDPARAELMQRLRDVFTEANQNMAELQQVVTDGMLETGRAVVRDLRAELGEDYGPPWGDPEETPRDILMALKLVIPHALHGKAEGVLHAMEQAMVMSRVPAAEFYLPEAHMLWFYGLPWTPEDSLKLLQPRLDADGPGRLAHASARSTKVGRNAPCPCGSGKKHKQCCGSVAARGR